MEIEIYKIFKNILPIISKLHEFIIILKRFSSKWNLKSANFNDIISNLEDGEKELHIIKCKSLRNSKTCVFFGRTSTGKSSLINRLIGESILPTGFGSVSNRIVEIKSSLTNQPFLCIKENDTIKQEDLNSLKIIAKQSPIENFAIPIKVFYSNAKYETLKNLNMSIFDTPGIDKSQFEPVVGDLCRNADMSVMIVSSLSEFGTLEKNVLLRFKNKFSDLNVLVVYSFFDIIHTGPDFDEICKHHENVAEDFLFNELNVKEEYKENKKNVFFLSGLEKEEFNFNDEISINKYQIRQNRFSQFQKRIESEMEETDFARKLNYLKKSEDIFDNLYNEFNKIFTDIIAETNNLVEEIKSEMTAMENLGSLNVKVNKEVDIAFKSIVDCVVKNGKKAVDCKNESKILNIEKVINDTVENEIDKLKNKVKDLINGTECNEFCKNVLNEVYFSKYFNYRPNINMADDEDIMKNLLNIKKSDKIKTGMKTGMDSAMSVAAVASGGITVGATAAIDAAAGIASLITGKDISISSFLKFIKKPFHFIWDREEENIKKHFIEIKDNLKDSIITLPQKIESDINEITDPLKESFVDVQNSYEKVKEEFSNFRDKSFIYM